VVRPLPHVRQRETALVCVRGLIEQRERVASELGMLAWILDDTGIARDGRHSPWAKRR
jgi:hypothetical protein